MAMAILSKRLLENQTAGRLAEMPLRMVHHRPPKKIAPSRMPTSSATMIADSSLIFFLRFIMHSLILLNQPMPRIRTADDQPNHQQHQRPGMGSRMAPVPPQADHRATERRHCNGPADQTCHAQAEPYSRFPFALCPELASSLRGHLPSEGTLLFQLIAHVENPPIGL